MTPSYVPGIPPAPVILDEANDPVQSDSAWDDPLALATSWLPQPGQDRMLMTVSTVGRGGVPDARTTMLSDFDGERFFFHTDAASSKVAELAANPGVALTLLWPGFSRQLVVQGTASRESTEQSRLAYRDRSAYLQQLAWQNTPEFAQLPLAARREQWSAFLAAHGGPEHPDFSAPLGWVGFAVTPHRLVFWVSNPAAASRRVAYERDGSRWARTYLPG